MKEHGDRIKAYYILQQYIKKYKEKEINDIYSYCFEKFSWTPERLMKNVIAKIIRCANMNSGKAFFLWKLEY